MQLETLDMPSRGEQLSQLFRDATGLNVWHAPEPGEPHIFKLQAADRVIRIAFVNSEVFALGNRPEKWVKLFKQKLARELAHT